MNGNPDERPQTEPETIQTPDITPQEPLVIPEPDPFIRKEETKNKSK